MSWREFVASVVGSLAWPSAAALAVLLLRKELRGLLGGPLTRLKAGPVEAEWDRGLGEVTSALGRYEGPGAAHSQDETAPGLSAADILDIARAQRMAEKIPVVAVGKAYGLVERRLKELLNNRGIVATGGLFAYLDPLIRDGTIDSRTADAIAGLLSLRQKASHDDGSGLSVTPGQAAEYVAAVGAVLERLAPLH